MLFELLLDVMDRFLNLRDTNAECAIALLPSTCANHTVPYGTALWGGAVPGTSCQATIAPSLRDISQPALVRQTETRGLLDSAHRQAADELAGHDDAEDNHGQRD
jgi:hypothetical protein